MQGEEFTLWLSGVARLSAPQRREAIAALSRDENDAYPADVSAAMPPDDDVLQEACRARLESRGCPHCAGRSLVSWGSANGLPRFRCKDCGRTFNGLTKTPMARLRKKPQWLANAEAMIAATTVARAAEIAGVDYTTAFRWRHRFLGLPALNKPKKLEGIVEAGATFLRESHKGRKPGRKSEPPQQVPETIAVLIARDRLGATIDAVLPRLDATAIESAVGAVVGPDNRLVGGGDPALRAFAAKAKIPVAPEGNLDEVGAYRDRLHDWLRRFHGVATKNLPNYLGWRRALEAWGEEISATKWILGAVGLGPYP